MKTHSDTSPFSGCGIAGVFDWSEHQDIFATSQLIEMSNRLAHRGPNGEGVFTVSRDQSKAGVGIKLAHRRLSILDLSDRGAQPMTRDHLTIVYNGELYNYREVRSLLGRDFQFSTDTDTEVVLRAFQKWGQAALNRFVGMFAFAIWNSKSGEIFLARDQIGIKPLYFYRNEDALIFASEIEALLASGVIPRKLNEETLFNQILCSSTLETDPTTTLIAGVQSLEAGTFAFIGRNGVVRPERYWDLPVTKRNPTLSQRDTHQDTVDHFNQLFSASTQSMLMGDVPVAVFLSGGLDSTAIALKTFEAGSLSAITINYIETPVSTDTTKELSAGASDLHYSRELIKWLKSSKLPLHNVQHHVVEQSSDIGVDDIDTVCDFAALGDDHRHVNILRNYQSVLQLGFKVVLNGQGADETMGGYVGLKSFVESACDIQNPNAKTILKLPMSRRTLSPQLLSTSVLSYEHESQLKFAKSLESISGEPVERAHRLLYKTQLARVLRFEDFLSMRTSVESRVPFLDHRLVEFCFSIPFAEHFQATPDRLGKMLLRDALLTHLPETIVKRPKQVFPSPDQAKLHRTLAGLIQRNADEIADSKILNLVLKKPVVHETLTNPMNLPLRTCWLILHLWRLEVKLQGRFG